MKDPRCDIEVGVHPSPFWVDKKSGLKVCSRHKEQYQEREGRSGGFLWAKRHQDFSAFINGDDDAA